MKKYAIVLMSIVLALIMTISGTTEISTEINDVQKKTAGHENRVVSAEDIVMAYDADGNEIDIDEVDKNEYNGYIVTMKDNLSREDIDKIESNIGNLKNESAFQSLIDEKMYTADKISTIEQVLDPETIAYIEPDYIGHVTDFAKPNDAKYENNEWAYEMMNLPEVWSCGIDGSGVGGNPTPVVGIIDSGLMGTGSASAEGRHEDIDYSKVAAGKSFALMTDEDNTNDTLGHGSFIAGCIAAKQNNGVGITGAMPGVKLKPYRVLGSTGLCLVSSEIAAINAAIEDGVDVMNISLGFVNYTKAEEEVCDAAADAGIIICASAGNDGNSNLNYPASYDSVIGVGSVNKTGTVSDYSQRNNTVDVSAPGEDITSLDISGTNKYKVESGTSFSAPQAAALAAMCKSIDPFINLEEFRELLKTTSQDKGAKGYDDCYGWGIIDFEAMYAALDPSGNNIRKGTAAGITDKVYTGEAVTQDSIVVSMPGEPDDIKLTEGIDYTVSYENNTEIGEARVIVRAIGDTYSGKLVRTFKITGTLDQAGAVVTLDNSSYVHTGSPITPAVTVRDKNGKILLADMDYKVKYSNNTDVGTGTVTVTGTGIYSGEKTVQFEITEKAVQPTPGDVTPEEPMPEEPTPAEPTDPKPENPEPAQEPVKVAKTAIKTLKAGRKSFTVTWNKKSVTGYQVQYSTKSDFKKGSSTKIKKITKKSIVKYKASKLKAKKKYYVRIRCYKIVEGEKYYSGWSSKKTVKTKK